MSPRLAVLLLALSLAGCLHAVEIPPVALSVPGSAGGSLPMSLGVVELSDLRPREQQRGRAPWLIPLIVWNQRSGRYVTSSEHLGGDVPRDVSLAVAKALSGWRFGRGRVLELGEDADPSALAELCAAEDLAYLATGEIQHLYGAVRQRAWLFIIPTPWIQGVLSGNQVGDPVGVARLSLRVHDCHSGDEVVSERLVSEGVFPRLSASAAAQRAFDQLMREVADLGRVPDTDGRAIAEQRLEQPLRAPDASPEPEPEAAEPPEDGEPELVPL